MSSAKSVIHRYFHQLANGCGNRQCSNIYCRSSSSFQYVDKNFLEDRNRLAAEAVRLFSTRAELCLDENDLNNRKTENQIKNLTEENLQDLIHQCKQINNWDIFRNEIELIFSNRLNLSTSFLKKQVREPISLNQSSDSLIDEITLDYEVMKNSIKLISSYEDEISTTMHKSLKCLLNDLISTKQDELETDANSFNIFFIIFELPFLSDPMFIYDIARLFYSNLIKLSTDAQAKFVRLLSKYSKNLDHYIAHVQQYITLHTFRWCEKQNLVFNDEVLLSNEPGMKEGLETLRMLFYANLLSSQRDCDEILEKERLNDDKIQLELIRRRQQIVDETDSNDAVTTAESPSIRTRRRRQSNSDSSFENPLERKLDLEPNEYRHPRYPFEDFINEYANENIHIKREYFEFLGESNANKIALINVENRTRMILQQRSTFIHNILHDIPLDPYFKLCIRRDHLVEDALISLEYQGIEHPAELKKQLFVEFEGEQGHDEGGLSKEFFQLIIQQIFNLEYGMFMTNEETRCLWFNPSAIDDLDREYTLIGMLVGLAIYNSVILDIRFSPVIYRKLMGKIGTFEDLESSHPTIYKNLQNLLTFDENEANTTIEEAFGLTFQIAISDAMGSAVVFDLKENGQTIAVTKENREEFVRLYSDVILNQSIERQFHPFYHGFLLVTNDSSLRKIFRANEIDLLVAGTQTLDFKQLELATQYDSGYTKDSPTIQNFWSVVDSFTDEQNRKFLRFTTGSDRAPIGGLARLKLIISRNGPDTEHLPTAHTCFNVLLLPDYSSKEKLLDKLSIAIDNAQGFGLR